MRTNALATPKYRAYQYLGVNYDPERDFHLPPELGRVPSQGPEVTVEEEERSQALLENNLVISVHDHPTRRPTDPSLALPYRRSGRDVTAYHGLSVSGLDAVFDNLTNGTNQIVSTGGWTWLDTVHDLGMRQCDFDHQELLRVCRRLEDLLEAKRTHRISVILTLEALTSIEGELDRVDVLYGLGIRSAGLVYSHSNQLGSGLAEAGDGGLTDLGRRVVHRMNQLGMLIDISHAGDRTSRDIIETSEVPVVISHAGARALWPTNRMKPDDVIVACAERGGVIGIEAAPHTTITPQHRRHNLDSVMEHFEYCCALVGNDHVTFGPDTNYGDHVEWSQAFRRELSIGRSHGGAPEYEAVAYVDGIENPSEAFPNIVRWLVSHGYSDTDIGKVIGGNTLAMLQRVWL